MVGSSETPAPNFPKFVLGRNTGPRPRPFGWRLGLTMLFLAAGGLVFFTNAGNVREKSARLYSSLAGSLAVVAKSDPGNTTIVASPLVNAETARQLAEARSEVDTLRVSLRLSEERVAKLNSDLEHEIRNRAEALVTKSSGESSTRDAIRKLNVMFDQVSRDKAELEQRITNLNAQHAQAIESARTEESRALDEMLATASAENNQLRKELEALKTKSADQSRTIYEWAPERTKATQTIWALQRDLSLRDMQIKEQADTITRFQQEATESSNRVAGLENQVRFSTSTRAVWGAAAWSRKTGVIYALPNQTKERSAIDGALAICAYKSRGPCELVQSFNNLCISVARIDGQGARPDNWLASYGATWQESETKAVADCQRHYGRSCTLRFTNCSPDSLSNQNSD